jgi:hypothetical protein
MATEYLGTGLKRVADVALASGIAAQHIAASVNAVRTSGYSQHGKGAASYVSDSLATSALAAAHPRFCKQSLDGRYWRLALDGGLFDVMSGGAQGNGSSDDYAAIQAAINYALTFSSATIRFPAGTYPVSASPEIVHGRGLNLVGAGPDNTVILAGAFPAMKTKGLWRSRIEGLAFWCDGNTASGAFDLDGETDGSFGTQGNVFTNCMFFGNYNSKYAFTVSLVSGGYGQGSENIWIGCAFQGAGHNAGDALLYLGGTNALQNTLLTCNFQGFLTGIKVGGGSVDILHCGFQSTYNYEQIADDGWDVDASYSSLGDTITMTGCRSESLRIYRGGGAPVQITGFAHTPSATRGWAGTYSGFALNDLVRGQTAAGNHKCYRLTTAGTTGASEPAWPESGTVIDGTAVWTQLDFAVFHGGTGRFANGQMQLGQFWNTGEGQSYENIFVTRDDCFYYADGLGGISGPGPRVNNVRLGGAPPPANTLRSIFIGNNSNPGARNTNPKFVGLSDQSLVWNEGLGGGTHQDISIGRGGGNMGAATGNYFDIKGGIGFQSISFLETTYNAAYGVVTRPGVVFYVYDGTPGSVPLTGGGTGCLAVYQSGIWQAVNLGAGIIKSDGVGGVTLAAAAPGAPAVTLVNGAGCTVGADSITCTSASGWGTAGAYGTESYAGDIDLVANVTGTLGTYMLGLNSDPTADNSYTSIDHALYVAAGSPATLHIWENGGAVTGAVANIVDGDQIAVRRVGTTIKYYHNRTLVHTTTGVSASTPLYLDAAFNSSGGVLENISFGPDAFNQPSVTINGVIKPDGVPFSGLSTLVAEAGDTIFVTDGMPGTSPLTGSGTGSLAIYQDGAWRALAMGSGSVSDGDKGDVTVSASGATWTIDSNAVTNAKMADMANATIKGRTTAGTGDPEDLTPTQVRALINVQDGATANSSDATLLSRSNHTGTQAASTISDFTEASQDVVGAMVAAAGGSYDDGAGTIAFPSGSSPGGASGELQYNNAGAFAGAANVEVDGGNLKLVSTTDPAAPAGGITLYSKLIAGRHLPKMIGPIGIDTVMQVGLHGNSVFMFGPASGTAAPVAFGGSVTTSVTMSMQQTVASSNSWLATQRKRWASNTTAGSVTGCRTAYVQWFRGNAAGFGGFFFRAQFGQTVNINGAQCFVGLCASTGILGTTAGAVGALINMIGVGYDTTDASTGNWQLFRNDGTGTATKVDLGATNAARGTTHGYDLIIFCPPGAASEMFVRIVNLHTGAVVLDTSYTTDIPAVNTGLAFKAEISNGAVASAVNIELAKVYIESDY